MTNYQLEITPEIAAVLDAAYVPAEQQPYCYITADGMIYTPEMDEAGEVLHDGKQQYETLQAYTPPTTEPSLADRVADIEAALAAVMYGGDAV